ncbi:hypothetical protein PsorP6_016167 [Peronosclerospora sorghi]|uniref:Uncharacterized protein n=1 Tax=Peronosclerospora sorghi TaxID=230839 RepID=A0ACC0VQR7_9STRA|nr:hypothetical protein PsorP6_016167 [Peronosclerospora sorghi]
MKTVEAEQTLSETLPLGADSRLDLPGVMENFMLMGSITHAMDETLLKTLEVDFLVDAENPRKRLAHPKLRANPAIDTGRIDLDDDFSYDEFKSTILHANKLIQAARSNQKTVFVFCTHGNNESAVVCIAFLVVIEHWSLARAYRHVLQKRPASAPRKSYVEKLRTLELETHGRVTLRLDQIGPSMIDLMLGLRGQQHAIEEMDERTSLATDARFSTFERASIMSNLSVLTGPTTNGTSLCETTIITEQGGKRRKTHPHLSHRTRSKAHKGNCTIC